jgi:hypothetical protein
MRIYTWGRAGNWDQLGLGDEDTRFVRMLLSCFLPAGFILKSI